MKRILLINNGYPSKTHPNYVTYIAGIEDCLKDAGLSVDLLVLNSNFRSKFMKYVRFFNYYVRLFFFFRYKSYDYVYINNFPYSFLPLIVHFPFMKNIIIHWHGDDINAGTKKSGWLNRLSYVFVRRDVIHVAPSKFFASEASTRLGVPLEEILVSPAGGVDTEVFLRRDEKRRRPGVIRLGFASALIPTKGIELVIDLLKQAPAIATETGSAIEFHFIDYGALKARYTPQLERLPGVVKHSPYPISDMVNFYNEIDILLFPTQRESLGLVALEAMACEAPVVCPDDFAFREMVVEGVSGERFIPGDAAAFRRAVTHCILNIHRYDPRTLAVEHYSKQHVTKDYATWFA